MKSKTFVTSLIFSLILVLGLGMAPIQASALAPDTPQKAPTPSSKWNLLYIDGLLTNASKGTEPSIAFDQVTNTPYISYYNNNTHNLILGRPLTSPGLSNCAFGDWWCPVVDQTSDVGLGSSLAIHDQVSTVGGKLGISYYDATNKRLKFAQWACNRGCTWTIYSFPSGTSTFDSGRYSSLKYNSLGQPQIAYTYNSTEPGNPWSAMKFCKWVGSGGDTAGGAFSCEYVEQLPVLNCCTNPSLALDPVNDNPRIAYYDGQFSNLRYAQGGANGGGDCSDKDWYCDWIDFTGDVGKYPSLDFVHYNNSNYWGIAYYDATNGKLKYAYPVPATGNCGPLIVGHYYWKCDTIDNMGTGITLPSISLILDPQANPIIAYQDFGAATTDLKIARIPGTLGLLDGNCGPVTGVLHPYRCDVVDPGGHGGSGTSDDGYAPSITRSASRLIYIAYKEVDGLTGTLKLAYQTYGTYLPKVSK